MKECNLFQHRNPDHANYCRLCGWKFGSGHNSNSRKAKYDPAPRLTKLAGKAKLFACFLVIATLTIGSCYVIMSSNELRDRQVFSFMLGLAIIMALSLLIKALYEQHWS